jgi:hypothetical protein
MSARTRTVLTAAVLAATLIVVYAGAGGGDFEPTPVADPCTRGDVRSADDGLFGTAERIGLQALDGAACDLDVSREKLLLALAGEQRLDIDEGRRNDAFRAGLRSAIDKEQDAGRLGGIEASLLRAGIEILPVDALLDRVFTR